MKVKLNINRDTYIVVSYMLSKLYTLQATQIQNEKIYLSIGFDLADKFENKARALKKSSDLLNAKQKPQITLKFHEAWALHEIIHDLLQVINLSNYDQNLISQLLNTLHQKTI